MKFELEISKVQIFFERFMMIKKLCLAILGLGIAVNASAGEVKKLPAPDKSAPLLKMMDERFSGRDYSSKDVGLQVLSEILWSAFGVNERGTRTIPTARNQQNLNVYVVYQNAVWMYKQKTMSWNKYWIVTKKLCHI